MRIIIETIVPFHLTIQLTEEQYDLYEKLSKERKDLTQSEILDLVYEEFPMKKEEEL
jgi:hypothetical protein